METTRRLAIFRINFKSDFVLTLQSDAGWNIPFCIKFWTSVPTRAYYAGWDGTTYTHCAPVAGDSSKLQVQFDNHNLPIGELKYQIGYHFTVDDFPNDPEDEVINQEDVIIDNNGRNEKVLLDFNGETAPDIQFSLPAYANEAQRIANEEQRIENEQARILNEETRTVHEWERQRNEQTRIAQEEARERNFAQMQRDSESATSAANDAATLANSKARLAQEKAEYAQQQGDFAKAQGETAQLDHTKAAADHQTALADHQTAADDHQAAVADHQIAAADHQTAEADHTRAGQDHTDIQNAISAADLVYDISKAHASGGVLATYADLSAALGTNGANVPVERRQGGMTVQFVRTSDNKYLQFRYMLQYAGNTTAENNKFVNPTNWQGVDDVPTSESDNLITSGAVKDSIDTNRAELNSEIEELDSKKANIDGYYESMGVGRADNLIGEPIPVTTGYTLKPTGYDPTQPKLEFADGQVNMTEIEGRVCAWNQLVQNGNFANGTTGWRSVNATISAENNILSAVAGSSNIQKQVYLLDGNRPKVIVGHKYLVTLKIKPPKSCRIRLARFGSYSAFIEITPVSAGVWNNVANIVLVNGNIAEFSLYFDSDSSLSSGDVVQIKDIQLIDLTLLNQTLAAKANLTVAEVEEYLATLKTLAPYIKENAGTLLGAKMLGWQLRKTANLLNPTTKQAKLFEYAYTGHDNEYTVNGWDELTNAALQFTPYNTGVAESVTLDANNRFVIPSAGVLEVIASGGDITGDVSRVVVVATWDGSMDGEIVAYDEDNVEIDSAKIYYDNNGVKTQVFDGGIMRATGDGAADVRDRVYFDEVAKKWKAEVKLVDVDLGGANTAWSYVTSYTVPYFILNIPGIREELQSTKWVHICAHNSGDYPADLGLFRTSDSSFSANIVYKRSNAKDILFKQSSITSVAALKATLSGKHLWLPLRTPVVYTNDLYYKVGDNYLPMEEVFPNGIQGLCCNWASENLVEQAEADGQPQSITPITTEVFQSDYKELLKTIGDTYISKEQAKDTYVSATEEQEFTEIQKAQARENIGAGTYSKPSNGIPLSDIDPANIDSVPTAGSNNLVKSGGVADELALGAVYDVTAKNSGATFASLSALLSDANLETLIPTSVRKGGMSIKFVQSSDNKYVMYMYKGTDATTVATFTNTSNWEKINLEVELGQLYTTTNRKIINVNAHNNHPAAYSNRYEARNAVPNSYRVSGNILVYLLANGWIIEQYIGESTFNEYADKDFLKIVKTNELYFLVNFGDIQGYVKELYLEGVDDLSLYQAEFVNNNSTYWGLYIRKASDNTVVASYAISQQNQPDDGVYRLEEKNSSGISGYAYLHFTVQSGIDTSSLMYPQVLSLHNCPLIIDYLAKQQYTAMFNLAETDLQEYKEEIEPVIDYVNTTIEFPVASNRVKKTSSTYGWGLAICQNKTVAAITATIPAKSAAITKVRVQLLKNSKSGETLADKTIDVNIAANTEQKVTVTFDSPIKYSGVIYCIVRYDQPADRYGWSDYSTYPYPNILPCGIYTSWTNNPSDVNAGFYIALDVTYTEIHITDAEVQRVEEKIGVSDIRQASDVGILVSLPDKIHAVVGDTLQLFYKGMIGSVNPYDFDILVTCTKGKQYPRYWEFVPVAGDIGEHTLTLQVKSNKGQVLSEKSTTIKVVPAPSNPQSQKNVVCIGDSNTADGAWPAEAYRRLIGSGGTPLGKGLSNISFCGLLTKKGAGYCGFGGWTWESYITHGATAIRFTVSGVSADPEYGSVYSNNGKNFTVQEVNITAGSGTILCTIANSSDRPTSSGTLTKVSGNGDTEIVFSAYAEDDANPFWDTVNNKFSFVPYANLYCNGTIDVVYTMLTWNNLVAWRKNWDAFLANVTTFATTLHSEFPNAKLRILGMQVPPVLGSMGYKDSYGMVQSILEMNDAYQGFANEHSEYVEFVNVSTQFDTDNCCRMNVKQLRNARSFLPYDPDNTYYFGDTVDKTVYDPEEQVYKHTPWTCIVASVTGEWNANKWQVSPERVYETYCVNAVHPGYNGYCQIGDVVYRDFVANFCQNT